LTTAQPIRTRPGRWLRLLRVLAESLRVFWHGRYADRQRRRIERDMRTELARLDGRTLSDLGLDRSQIPWIAGAAAGHGRAMHIVASSRIGGED
jgi:uncharacterized protein YjiS (DUF1127 family)